jgi:hypothetical protein
MSVNAISHAANIWSRTTSALSATPQAQGLDATKPNEAGASRAKPNQAGSPQNGVPTPFQALSSNLQSALIQLQAQKTGTG